MGRLRARLATNEVDRTVQSEVATAFNAVERAIRACRQAEVGPNVSRARLNRVARDLARVRSALGNVGKVSPGYDLSDPDLMSEDERAAEWRRRLEESRRPVGATPASQPSVEGGD